MLAPMCVKVAAVGALVAQFPQQAGDENDEATEPRA